MHGEVGAVEVDGFYAIPLVVHSDTLGRLEHWRRPADPGLPVAPVRAGCLELANVEDAVLVVEVLDKPERRMGAGNFIRIAVVGAAVTRFSDRWLRPKTAYVYRIAATNAAGASLWSNEARAATAAPQVARCGRRR